MTTANNDLDQVEKKKGNNKGASGDNNPAETIGSPYGSYHKWRVDVEVQRASEHVISGHKFTAVKKLKESVVKLSPDEAAQLNAQSHNSRVRYYEDGSMTNGYEEEVSL